jgi:aryl-alcohol dehydrogenase-like predicted oxidoreductase
MNARLHGKHTIRGIDKPLSALALGTAAFRLADRERWFALLDDFRRLGGTLIDSGRSYGDSEAVIGQWLETRQARQDVVLVTKCAHGDAILPAHDFEQVVTRELGESLDTLHTDHIDLYMLHRDNPLVSVGRIVERMNREIERGTVSALGASNWTYARVDEANAYAARHSLHGFAVVSNNLSLAVPAAPFYPNLVSTDRAGERWHEATATPLLSWSSQARGFFTGRDEAPMRAAVQGEAIDNKDAFAKRMVEVYGTPDNLERLRRARKLGAELGRVSAIQIALAWLLHKPFPLLPVIGPRTPEELASCVDACSISLTPAQCAWLDLET